MGAQGSTALIKVASNPRCTRLVAMVQSGLSEPNFYRALTGEPYDREFGERVSARRRGYKFEDNLFGNGAARLRTAVAEVVGLDPAEMYVRDLTAELPGVQELAKARRFSRTRSILQGEVLPHVIVKPQLRATVAGLPGNGVWIEPDFIVRDHMTGCYLPGDAKSFVVDDNRVEPGDLRRVRLQMGAQVVALRELIAQVGLPTPPAEGFAVFASPYGLDPHPAMRQDLAGAVHDIARAVEAIEGHAHLIAAAQQPEGAALHIVAPDLPASFEDSCISGCVLANYCRAAHTGTARDLGDQVVAALGGAARLDRVAQLLNGAEPTSPEEAALQARLQASASVIGARVA